MGLCAPHLRACIYVDESLVRVFHGEGSTGYDGGFRSYAVATWCGEMRGSGFRNAWAKGEDGETKSDASDIYVPLHPVLAGHLRAWRRQVPYAKESDFVFPLTTAKARKPLYASNFVADYLRPAAKKVGVHIGDGQRFGPHNLRHSLSNWPVNKAEVEPKTVQGILRHSKIQTTLDLYT